MFGGIRDRVLFFWMAVGRRKDNRDIVSVVRIVLVAMYNIAVVAAPKILASTDMIAVAILDSTVVVSLI